MITVHGLLSFSQERVLRSWDFSLPILLFPFLESIPIRRDLFVSLFIPSVRAS